MIDSHVKLIMDSTFAKHEANYAKIDKFCNQIAEFNSNLEKISSYSPISYWKIKYIKSKKIILCHKLMFEPADINPVTGSKWQLIETTKAISAFLKLQVSWNKLAANIDRKLAYLFSVWAIYLSALSIFISLFS